MLLHTKHFDNRDFASWDLETLMYVSRPVGMKVK